MTKLLEMLGDVASETFAEGTVLIRQDQPFGRILILEEGEVEIVKGDVPIYKISKEGSTFGEMSALLDVKSTATVVATRESRFRVIESPKEYLAENAGATLEIARLLAHRVRWLTVNYANEIDDGDSVFWRYR